MTVITHTRPNSLVGREVELHRAVHALQFSAGALIMGESGIGKTALASAVIEQLPAPPLARLVATAAARSIPFGALSQLLPLDLTAVHPALVVPQLTAHLRRTRPAGASRVPPVLVVDDVQLLDAQSAAALLALVSNGTIRLLATVRSGSEPSDAVTALWKEELVERIDLAPLDRSASRDLLESVVDGPVASGTVEMLWSHSGGNPLYLGELARYGREQGALVERAGVWWWLGGTDLPPRLGELLTGRLDAASAAASEAIDVLAMGEPLPYDTLSAVAGNDAVLELDRLGLLDYDQSDAVLRLRFAHPLLLTVAKRRLSPARRRMLAGRLRQAPAEQVDVIRRARWETAAGGEVDVALLLRAADAALIHDPASAAGFAERAAAAGGGLGAGLLVAAARSEQGRPELAAAALTAMSPYASTDDERYLLLTAEFSVALWGRRTVREARHVLGEARSVLPDAYRSDLLAAEALAALFSAECAETVTLAQLVLAEPASTTARIRGLTALTGALTFCDRGPEAVHAAQQLLDELGRHRVAAPCAGLAHALVGVTGLFFGTAFRLPRPVGRLGRWPGTPDALESSDAALPAPPGDEQPDLGWPLLVGLRRHFQGDLVGALGPLREAYVQQQDGEGLFRSEATAELIVVLAELGHSEEANRLLTEHPPDEVAIIPGLLPWAAAAVAAAHGQHSQAGDLATSAARLAAARGATAMALNFLTDAGRWGDPRHAAEVLAELVLPLTSDLQRARAADIVARGSGGSVRLVAAAEIQLQAGFNRHALELAERAAAVDTLGRCTRRITAVAHQARQRLGDQARSQATPAAGPLTLRESEVARLAAGGLTDRQVADELVLSVRTVQSHLASSYRKLGIRSRGELVGLV